MANAGKALRRAIVKYSKLVKGLDRLKKPSEILFRGLEGLEGWKLRKSQALSWQGLLPLPCCQPSLQRRELPRGQERRNQP